MDDLPTQALPPSDEDKASTASKTSMEIEAQHKDNLVCPQHAGEKIVVVSVNESTDDLRLFCVSCMISDGGRTHDPTYKKLTLKDFFERILAKPKDNSMDQIEAEIKKKYVDFLAKDYKSLYDKEMNKQYQLLVNEIDGIAKGLNDFKEKIKDTIAGKINDICFKMEEVTRESNKFIEEGDNQSQIHFNSINEIYENLERMGDWKQTYGFFKDIYLKSKEKLFEENSPQKRGAKVMNKINDFETRFNKQITESIDLSKLKGNSSFLLSLLFDRNKTDCKHFVGLFFHLFWRDSYKRV